MSFEAVWWPVEMQQAVGRVVLSASLAESILSRFHENPGESGSSLVKVLNNCSESEVQELGATYSSLLDDRNALVHGFSTMGTGGAIRSTRFSRISKNSPGGWTVNKSYSLGDLHELSVKFQLLGARALAVEKLHQGYALKQMDAVSRRRQGAIAKQQVQKLEKPVEKEHNHDHDND